MIQPSETLLLAAERYVYTGTLEHTEDGNAWELLHLHQAMIKLAYMRAVNAVIAARAAHAYLLTKKD